MRHLKYAFSSLAAMGAAHNRHVRPPIYARTRLGTPGIDGWTRTR